MTNRKGIILAGGSGTRLYPITIGVSKQLLPIYDKPMIYYPLSVLMLAGIRDIAIITTQEDQSQFQRLMGDGSQWGLNFTWIEQPSPDGLAQAYLLAADFLDGAPSAMVLGDNIFFGHALPTILARADERTSGGTVFGYHVADPERYGVLDFDGDRVRGIVEKPSKPPSHYAVTGLYFLDGTAPERAARVKPSPRGELEITDLLELYLKDESLTVERMGRGYAWLDTGTHASLLDAGNFVRTLTARQGLQTGSPEEIAFEQGWITRADLLDAAKPLGKNAYGAYLRQIAGEQGVNTALVTGAAGFIGFHVARRWLDEGWRVVGLDAFTDYYDPKLKRDRAAILAQYPHYFQIEKRIETPGVVADILAEYAPSHIVHLAAQAGVRHSIDAPQSYVDANLQGTFALLEAARAHPGAHLLLASTSSVYGANTRMPYRETDKADSQMSFYAATKKATEAMAHSYAHLYDLPVTMFRFFTVYGPWGRPDMAPMKFVRAILADEPIEVYNHGRMKRDFTYIDDLVEAVWRLAAVLPTEKAGDFDSLSPVAPFRVVNIGKSVADPLGDFIGEIERALGRDAQKIMTDMQPGDVPATWSDTTLLESLTGFRATTGLAEGIPRFVSWYRRYFGV